MTENKNTESEKIKTETEKGEAASSFSDIFAEIKKDRKIVADDEQIPESSKKQPQPKANDKSSKEDESGSSGESVIKGLFNRIRKPSQKDEALPKNGETPKPTAENTEKEQSKQDTAQASAKEQPKQNQEQAVVFKAENSGKQKSEDKQPEKTSTPKDKSKDEPKESKPVNNPAENTQQAVSASEPQKQTEQNPVPTVDNRMEGRFAKLFLSAKEKARYYLGMDDDEDNSDDNIYSTSSEIDRHKNANPLDVDEEFKENVVYKAPTVPVEPKKEEPDLLKVAAQNTQITKSFTMPKDKKGEAKQKNMPENPKAEDKIGNAAIKTVPLKDVDPDNMTLDEIIASEKSGIAVNNSTEKEPQAKEEVTLPQADVEPDSVEEQLPNQMDFSMLEQQAKEDEKQPQKPLSRYEMKFGKPKFVADETTTGVNNPIINKTAQANSVVANGQINENNEEKPKQENIEAKQESAEAVQEPVEDENQISFVDKTAELNAVAKKSENQDSVIDINIDEPYDESAAGASGIKIEEKKLTPLSAEQKADFSIDIDIDEPSDNNSAEKIKPQKEFNIDISIDDNAETEQNKPEEHIETGFEINENMLMMYKHEPVGVGFVVMAGKFTKTVRSEYREYRRTAEKTNSPRNSNIPYSGSAPKQGQPRGRQRTSSQQNQEADKQQDESHKPKIPREKKVPEKSKPTALQMNAPASVKPPVPPVAAPVSSVPLTKMPTAVDDVSTNGKKSRTGSINRPRMQANAKEDNEAKLKKSEEEERQKAEKKKKLAEEKAKKKEQRKKKFDLLKLFNTEEEISDEDSAIKKYEQIDDYANKNEENEIKTEILDNYRRVAFRLVAMVIVMFFSIVMDVILTAAPDMFASMTFGWLLAAFINLIILGAAVFFCRIPIFNGFSPLKNFKGNSDTAVAVASVASVVQAVVAFFIPDVFINGSFHFYTSLVVLALLINTIGRFMIISRVYDNFKFITKPSEKFAGKIITDESLAKKMSTSGRPIIAYQKKTKFLSDFLKLSYAPDPSEELASRIAPIFSVAAVVLALIFGIVTQSVAGCAGALALFTVVLTPICCLVAVNLPMKKLCSTAVRSGSMVSSYEAVKQFCDTNAIVIDAAELYPSGTVTMSGIRTFSGNKVDDTIAGAAAIMMAVNCPLTYMFKNIIQDKTDTLPQVESVIYEDGLGLVGWVNGQRILLGNRRLLDAHSISVPSLDYEEKYIDQGKQALYLSLGGELIAMFIVTYSGDRAIADELRRLEHNGVTFIIRTVDSNITQDQIARDFGVFYRSVKILPTGLGNVCKEMTDTPDNESRAYIATRGGIASFARAVSSCIKIKSNITLSLVIQMVGIVLGILFVTIISFVSGIGKLNVIELLIFFAFWIAATLIAPAVRKP